MGMMPIAAFSMVLLPEPLGPVIEINSDLEKERERSVKICFLP